MMECRDIDELMVDFLYQELEAGKAEAFEAHVKGCARCSAEIQSLQRTREALRSLPEAEPSPAVSTRLLHEAGKRAARDDGGLLGWLTRMIGPVIAHPAWAAAASLLLVAGVAGFLSLRGKVSEHAQSVDVTSGAAVSAPAAAAPKADMPASPPAGHAGTVEEKANDTRAEDSYGTGAGAGKPDVRKAGESAPPGYVPKVPAPAVASGPVKSSRPQRADEADKLRVGRAASADEDRKLFQPERAKGAEMKQAPGAGDDLAGASPASPPPASAAESGEAARDREQAVMKDSAAAGAKLEALRKEPPAPSAAPAPAKPQAVAPGANLQRATTTSRGAGAATQAPAQAQVAPSQAPEPAPAEAEIATKKAPAQEEPAAKTKESPEQGLLRLAQKQATSGRCDEALGTRQKIARMNPEFFRKRVAGDPSLRACEEQQNRRRETAPKNAVEQQLDESKTAK